MDKTTFAGRKIGFALTGSFCTLDLAVTQMAALRQMGAEILPVISNHVRDMDSRFGTAEYWRKRILDASGADKIIDNIPDAEPIGPQKLCEIMPVSYTHLDVYKRQALDWVTARIASGTFF